MSTFIHIVVTLRPGILILSKPTNHKAIVCSGIHSTFGVKYYFMNLLAMLRRPPTPPEEPPEAPPPLPPLRYILRAIWAADATTSCLDEPLGALPLAFCWSVVVLAALNLNRSSRLVKVHTEQLGGLAHGNADELVLAGLSATRVALVEHLHCLHSCGGPHVAAAARLVRAVAAAVVVVVVVVLLHSILLVNVLLVILARQHAKCHGEQARVFLVASVRLGVARSFGEVVIITV